MYIGYILKVNYRQSDSTTKIIYLHIYGYMFCIAVIHVLTQQPPSEALGIVS